MNSQDREEQNESRSFSAGLLIAAGIFGLIQDFLGLEAYMEYAKKHWISIKTEIIRDIIQERSFPW